MFIAHPTAFGVVLCFMGAWLYFDSGSFSWSGVATMATLFMTLFIQRAAHRDTQAIHAKLDELLRTQGEARNELIALDDEEPEAIEEHRQQERDKKG